MKQFRFFVVLLGTCALFLGCRNPSQTGKRYDLKGKVVSVDRQKQEVTIDHEEVKGYMPGMIMPFKLKDPTPLEVMAAGDQVTATLVVDGPRNWLEDVVVRQEGPLTATASGEEITEAKPGDEVPDYGLVNQDNKLIKVHEYRGKVLVLTFIYTRCPDPQYCTLMSSNFQAVDQELAKDQELYRRTHLLSISFDPSYDTPAVLRSYGAAYTGRYTDEKFDHWEFASGTMDQVKGIAQYFGLRYYQNSDQIIHGLRTVIIGTDGKVVKVYRGNEWKPDELLGELSKTVK
jgi:protein SCO1/2